MSDLYKALVDLSSGKEKSRKKVAEQFLSVPVQERQKAIQLGLKSSNPKIRRTTFAIMGEMQDQSFIDDVIKGLNDKHVDVIQMAVWAVGKMKYRDAIGSLVKLLKKGYGFKVTKTVIWAIGEIGDRSVLPVLVEKLQGASARLCEGILVCGIKLGQDVFMELIRSLDCNQESVQSALRDVSYASQVIRNAFISSIVKTKDSKLLSSILEALPYVTMYEADYKRLLADSRENVRLSAYQSIANSALPKAAKLSFFVQGLSDQSNRVVISVLENVFPYLDESGLLEKKIKEICEMHPSPKVRSKAGDILHRHQLSKQIVEQVPKWGRFLLETLPGIEMFVCQEAKWFGIDFRKETAGNGWMEIRLEDLSVLEEVKKLHTIARICGIVRIKDSNGEVQQNPHLPGEDLTEIPLDQVEIGNQTYEVIALFKEQELIRPRRKLRTTSLDWRVARAMVLCSNPKEDDVFLDPTCGSGTLLLDRATFGPYKRLIGGDLDSEALSAARHNLKEVSDVSLYQWDAASMQIPDQSVSVVAANLPFGRRVGNHESNVELYPSLLKETLRVLSEGGRAVFLTQEVTLLLDVVNSFKNELMVEVDQPVEMGGLTPHIICLRKRIS